MSKSAPSPSLSKDQIIAFITVYKGLKPQNLLINMLSYSPNSIKFGGSWNNLGSITVRQFLLETFRSKNGAVLEGESLITAIIQSNIHEFAERYLAYLYGPIHNTNINLEKQKIIKALAHPDTKFEAYQAAYEILEPVLDDSVLDAIRTSKGKNELYVYKKSSTPETLLEHFGSSLIYAHECAPGYFLNVFRRKIEQEYPTQSSVHEVLSTVHLSDGELVGACSVEFVKNPDGSMSSLGQTLDENDCTESAALAMSVCIQVIQGEIDELESRHAAFVLNWEVCSAHQGKGLGKILLNAALGDGSKRLGRPDTVFSHLNPLSFKVPPQNDATVKIVEYEKEKNELVTIWNKCTNNGTKFAKSNADFYNGRYIHLYNMIGNCHLMGLGFFMDLDF